MRGRFLCNVVHEPLDPECHPYALLDTHLTGRPCRRTGLDSPPYAIAERVATNGERACRIILEPKSKPSLAEPLIFACEATALSPEQMIRQLHPRLLGADLLGDDFRKCRRRSVLRDHYF